MALLRTLDKDHILDLDNEEGLILHGCGTILMMGCPISIHWTVKHIEDKVILTDFTKVISTNHESLYYTGLEIELSRNEYRNQILSFALKAKKYLINRVKKELLMNLIKKCMKSSGMSTISY
ncbi:hypothetical protein DJ93_1134 [Bacillus clarus]|uniref:Uncharacterized protein n=1 Tax=Bacillus clarus TaxID=2338372 RepID=A0A090YXU2_9BACI|nr:hypothetical protein [Bacillus clarus]KFN03789.1 hypothetical protein DJ93_1134 [Bacillus clarus]